MDTELVRSVAQGLRYRPLDHLVGRVVQVTDLARVEEDIRRSLDDDFPAEAALAHPELQHREGAVAKYGILDLSFTVPDDMLAGAVCSGVPLLRDLGFLPGSGTGPQQSVCDDPVCLEILQDDLAQGRTWLRLFLNGGRPEALPRLPLRVPEGYLPRPFQVIDACITNADGVWLWKYAYL